MQNKSQFLYLLDHCMQVVKKYANVDRYPDYALYSSRYIRMIDEISQIKSAVNEGNLATNFKALEITNMLDRNDPDEIKHHILQLNQYYLSHFQDK